jgi:hypothetical protein
MFKSFYVVTLQMNDIQKELASLKGEQEQHAKDSSQYSGLERTYEGLLTAVKTLEVTLLNTSTLSYLHNHKLALSGTLRSYRLPLSCSQCLYL